MDPAVTPRDDKQENNVAEHPWITHYPPDVKWDAKVEPAPLYQLLDDAASRFGTRPCVDFLGRKYSYAQVAGQVERLAAGLQKMGVRQHVKVGLCLPNCPQYVVSYFAILKAGGTVVNFNPLYTERELAHQIEDSGTEIMITLALESIYPKVAAQLGKTSLKKIITSQLQEALPAGKRLAFSLLKRGEQAHVPNDAQHISFRRLLATPAERFSPVPCAPDNDIAVLQYTGGTTGVPKGAVLTHANLYCNALQCGLWFPRVKEGAERVLGVLPLFHVFAMTTVMNFGILKGAELILHPRFELKNVLGDIGRKRPTLMPGVPTMFNAINNCDRLKKYDLSSLKFCISGGAALPIEVKERFETLTRCTLIEGYGLSESSPVVSANPISGTNKTGSIGMPLPQTVLEVVDMEDGNKLLPQGETGEICIRGPQVMHGYWQQVEESKAALCGGRLHTGDVGYMDEEGYFFIVDRMKEMIISGGYNIYPRHIEEVLYTHPDIVEAAVVGVPHDHRGEVPKAFVVPTKGVTLDEKLLKDWLKSQLVAYAIPQQIEMRDALPKTLIGKVDKKALKN